jgi:AcrR family transcriptional regulator
MAERVMTGTKTRQREASDAEAAPDGARASSVRTTRDEWLKTAMDTLISDGVEKVKVLTIAQKLNSSRSSFYWFFKSRKDLLDQLLEAWKSKNTQPLLERAERPAATITEAVLNIFECWADEDLFDTRLDFAVREWARRSGSVRRALDKADNQRLDAITQMFVRHGYDPHEAVIRARTLYFMQVGYFALDLQEPIEARLLYTQQYLLCLTGKTGSKEEIERFAGFIASLKQPRSSAPEPQTK